MSVGSSLSPILQCSKLYGLASAAAAAGDCNLQALASTESLDDLELGVRLIFYVTRLKPRR